MINKFIFPLAVLTVVGINDTNASFFQSMVKESVEEGVVTNTMTAPEAFSVLEQNGISIHDIDADALREEQARRQEEAREDEEEARRQEEAREDEAREDEEEIRRQEMARAKIVAEGIILESIDKIRDSIGATELRRDEIVKLGEDSQAILDLLNFRLAGLVGEPNGMEVARFNNIYEPIRALLDRNAQTRLHAIAQRKNVRDALEVAIAAQEDHDDLENRLNRARVADGDFTRVLEELETAYEEVNKIGEAAEQIVVNIEEREREDGRAAEAARLRAEARFAYAADCVTLGVDPLADKATIKGTWRAAVKLSHPDRNAGNDDLFKAQNAAWERIQVARGW